MGSLVGLDDKSHLLFSGDRSKNGVSHAKDRGANLIVRVGILLHQIVTGGVSGEENVGSLFKNAVQLFADGARSG